MEYVFDNSNANPRNPDHPPRRVQWGWRSADEMADVWIQVMTRSDADRLRLGRDVRRKMAEEDVVGCEALIAREPDYVDLRNDAASLYLELGQPEAALMHFTVVSRLESQSAVARYNVGVATEAAGRTAAAAAHYEAAVLLDPTYSLAHNNLGSVRLAEGRLDEARRHYERAVATSATNAEARNNLGAVLLAAGDAGAIVYLQQAISLRPTYPEAHFNLARAYASMGRPADAAAEGAVAEAQAVAAGKAELTAQVRELLRLNRR
jgi:tetratricopeptide (TPR) repeat protein